MQSRLPALRYLHKTPHTWYELHDSCNQSRNPSVRNTLKMNFKLRGIDVWSKETADFKAKCVFLPEQNYVSPTQRSALEGGGAALQFKPASPPCTEDSSLSVCYMWFQVWFSKAATPLNCCKGSLHMKYANNIGFTLPHLPKRVHRNTCVSHCAALFVWPAVTGQYQAVHRVPAAFLWLRFKHARKHRTQSSL